MYRRDAIIIGFIAIVVAIALTAAGRYVQRHNEAIAQQAAEQVDISKVDLKGGSEHILPANTKFCGLSPWGAGGLYICQRRMRPEETEEMYVFQPLDSADGGVFVIQEQKK